MMNSSNHLQDVAYLSRALELAETAAQELGEVPIGAVLVVGDAVFEARNEKESRPDPTAHAEILLLRKAATALGTWRLLGATVYISKEPCVMCAGALVAARVQRIVFGAYDPKGGAAGSVINIFEHQVVNHRIIVQGGLLSDEASAQLQVFFRNRRLKEKKPAANK